MARKLTGDEILAVAAQILMDEIAMERHAPASGDAHLNILVNNAKDARKKSVPPPPPCST